jgi:hypothetical protein
MTPSRRGLCRNPGILNRLTWARGVSLRGTRASDCHAGIFGDWSSLMIGTWQALEIISDPYEKKRQGMVTLAAYLMCDINVRYPQAFTCSKYWSNATL